MNQESYLQLNVTNLFDTLYVGGFGGSLSKTSIPFAYIGSPRAISGTVNFAF
jgi:iron complex outermembrane recepter protein